MIFKNIRILSLLILVTASSGAVASSLRTIDGDAVISSDHSKTWTMPSTGGTLLNAGSISGGTNLKITYSSTGLVTSGTSASLYDLNNVSVSTPTSGQYLSYNGSNWVNATGPTAFSRIQEVPVGTPNSSTTNFTISHTPLSSSLLLWIDGIFQRPTIDYTISSTTITIPTPPAYGQSIYTSYEY